MWIIRWLTSRSYRQAVEFAAQVRKLRNAQRDLLGAEALSSIDRALEGFQGKLAAAGGKDQLLAAVSELEVAANQSLRTYPSPEIREHLEMLLVVATVVMACRAFFFQPMAIPSGSAQPTLWGITSEDLTGKPDSAIPSGARGLYESWILGRTYYHIKADADGEVRQLQDPRTVFPFVKKLNFTVGPITYTVWFPPEGFYKHAGLQYGRPFRAGEDIVKMRMTSGDHLFVNTLTYNFRHPRRGETIVFESRKKDGLIPNTHYIKRLVALGGEKVRVGDDSHLVINGMRLDASTRYFENVYTFSGPPRADHYSGHVNSKVARQSGFLGNIAPLFPDANSEYQVKSNHFLTMGDNTMNSHDSRAWGDFPRDCVIGKCGFVFWPITDRFGWGVD